MSCNIARITGIEYFAPNRSVM
jgi:hypothetical protein